MVQPYLNPSIVLMMLLMNLLEKVCLNVGWCFFSSVYANIRFVEVTRFVMYVSF